MASRRPAAGSRAAERRIAALTATRAQLRIELRDVKPLVWRRILVPETFTQPRETKSPMNVTGTATGPSVSCTEKTVSSASLQIINSR